MFPMIPISYPSHIGKWHPPLFLFPLYSQWIPKRISAFSHVPNVFPTPIIYQLIFIPYVVANVIPLSYIEVV
jgi:hypothetical protein